MQEEDEVASEQEARGSGFKRFASFLLLAENNDISRGLLALSGPLWLLELKSDGGGVG